VMAAALQLLQLLQNKRRLWCGHSFICR
jgi:hypothetical protein